MLTIILTIVAITLLSLVVLGAILWMFRLAKQDVHFTELAPNTGKLVKMGADIVNILFNSNSGYYESDGKWKGENHQSLGLISTLTGRVFFGLSPIYEIFHFDTSWGEYIEGKTTEDGKQGLPSVVPKTENGTKFKHYYPHSVMIHGAEMAKESVVGTNDTSTTRIDAVMLVTIEITNIIDAIFKIPPQGIIFAQANAALQGAFNDYVKSRKWEDFREENKLSQDSEFVKHILNVANPVLNTLGIGMSVAVVELKYYDFTPSPGNEALEESQTLLLIAQNKGAAEVALATREKEAAKLRGEGERDALTAVKEVVGQENIAAYANLGQVQKTQLRVYGPTNVVPVVNTGDKD